MTEKPRTAILPSDIDAQGNVTLWDHGPREMKKYPADTEEQAKARTEAHAASVKAWHDEHGDEPVPLIMHSSDAGQAMSVEPLRYSLEPEGVDEEDIKKRVQEMKDKRDAAANAVQNAIDRKLAIGAIMSERQAARTAAAVETEAESAPLPPPDHAPPAIVPATETIP